MTLNPTGDLIRRAIEANDELGVEALAQWVQFNAQLSYQAHLLSNIDPAIIARIEEGDTLATKH